MSLKEYITGIRQDMRVRILEKNRTPLGTVLTANEALKEFPEFENTEIDVVYADNDEDNILPLLAIKLKPQE